MKKTNDIPASFIKRLFAFCIDGIVLSSMTAIIMRINPNLLIVVSFGYFILFDASKKQGTVGKQMLGLKISNQDGQRLSYFQAFVRHVLKYFGILFLGIGYVGLLFNMTQKSALVDKLSKTQVLIQA